MELIYQVDKKCVVCEKTFSVTKVRSRLSMLKMDSDFCTYYRGVNPYYYTVWVCPHCGYAATDVFFDDLSVAAQEKITKFLAGRTVNVNLGGERTCEQGIAAYKIALFYAEMVHNQPSRLAGLYLKLAWLYREAGQAAEEAVALAKARDNYDLALAREHFPLGNLSDVAAEYLVGELSRRTGDLDKALLYLSKVVANPKTKLEKKVLEMARDAWYEAREAKKRAAAAVEKDPMQS